MIQFFTPYQEYPIASLSELITLLPILIGLYYFRSTKIEIKLLVILFICFFIRDIYSNNLAYLKVDNIFIYNIFSFLELFFLALIFYSNSKIRSVKYKQIIVWGAATSLLIDVFFYSKNDFSVENFTIVRLYGILIIMAFYERVLSELNIKNILTYSMFWISSGLLLYYSGTFFIFLLGDIVLSTKSKPEVFHHYWNMNLLFYMFFCLLASIGIWFSKYDQENVI